MARQCSGCQPSFGGGEGMTPAFGGPMGEVFNGMYFMNESQFRVLQADSQSVVDLNGMDIGRFGIVDGTWGGCGNGA